MKRAGTVALMAALFAGSVLYLFNRRFSGGNAYPAYSSLRSDPAGTKLIFESLSRVPGLIVDRSYLPLDRLPDRDSSILFLGEDPLGFAMQGEGELHAFEEFAQRGNRLVFSMAEPSGAEPPRPATLEKLWGVRMSYAFDKEGRGHPWFTEAKNWEVLEQDGGRTEVIQRDFDKGSMVLMADGILFANESVAGAPQSALISLIIGGHPRIVFDEAHFGIVESGSVMALARRFRLHGLALGLGLMAMLFIWRNSASFPPAAAAAREGKVSGRTSVAGLVTLLRRHIAPERLAAACWQEWIKSHARDITPARRAQAEEVLRRRGAHPAGALREIENIVRAKGAI